MLPVPDPFDSVLQPLEVSQLPSPFSVPLSLALTLRSYQSSHPGGIPGGWGKEISLLIAQRGWETEKLAGQGARGREDLVTHDRSWCYPKYWGGQEVFWAFPYTAMDKPERIFFGQSNNCCSQVGVNCFNSLLSKCKCTHLWKFHLCPLMCSVFHRVDAGPPS